MPIPASCALVIPSSTDAIRAACAALIDLDTNDVVADQTRPAVDLMPAVGYVPGKFTETPVSTLSCFISLIPVCGIICHGADVMAGETQIIEVAV